MIYGSAIAIMTESIKIEEPVISTVYLLLYGFVGIGLVTWIYHRKLMNIRKQIKVLSE